MNPHEITIHCDGAMDYDCRKTSGIGYTIDFPESINRERIAKFGKDHGQGIQRIEMLSILEAIESILSLCKQEPDIFRKASGITIYTDRHGITDGTGLNPWKINNYISNKWKTYEGKDVKDREIIDRIHKSRMKLAKAVGGRVEIKYKRRKENREADKLSKIGKKEGIQSRKVLKKQNVNISPRKFDLEEIDYSKITKGETIIARVYKWQFITKQVEVSVEIVDGHETGRTMNIYVSPEQKANLHRQHIYSMQVKDVYTFHVTVESIKEI